MENLRISVLDKLHEWVATIQAHKLKEDEDNEDSDIAIQVRAAKRELLRLRQQGRKVRATRRKEWNILNQDLYEKQRKLHRLGKKAQRNVSLYEYAVLMREPPTRTKPTNKTVSIYRLIDTSLREEGETFWAQAAAAAAAATTTKRSALPETTTTTLVLRSQTFYGSSAFLWQLMVQTILQVRLLRKAHLLTMLSSQEAIFKYHKNEEVKEVAEYVKDDKIDEVCHGLFRTKASIIRQMEDTQIQTTQMLEVYTEVFRKQRKIMLKLKLRSGQAMSDQVKQNIQRRSSVNSLNSLVEEQEEDPFLAELKRASLKRLSTIAERASLLERASQGDLNNTNNGPMVEQIRMEILVDESLLQNDDQEKEEEEPVNGRSTPQSHVSSLGVLHMERSNSALSLEEPDEGHNIACHESPVSSSSILSGDEQTTPTDGTTTTRKKSRRAELRRSLNSAASLRSMDSCASRRSELEHRRLQAEQLLAKSKRQSQRNLMQEKRHKAQQRLEESKKRLQGFLTNDDDDNDDGQGNISDDDHSISYSHDLDFDFQNDESTTSLRSPDIVINFPYDGVSNSSNAKASLPTNED